MIASMEAALFNCRCDQMQNCEGGCETIHYYRQVVQLLSDTGGVLALWFGFALMTFLECIELLADVIALCVTRLMRRCHSPGSCNSLKA